MILSDRKDGLGKQESCADAGKPRDGVVHFDVGLCSLALDID